MRSISEFILGLLNTVGTVYISKKKNVTLGFNFVTIKIKITFASVLKCFQVFIDYSFQIN